MKKRSLKFCSKRLFFLLVLFFLTTLYINSEDSVEIIIEGSWSYSFSNNNHSCTLKGDRIVNRGKKDSFFTLAFYLCPEKYSGGSITGYKVGSKIYDVLETGYQYNDISVTFSDFEKHQPPNGKYYPVVLILGYKNSTDGIIDYLTFSNPCTFHNYLIDEVNDLLADLNYSRSQQNYWTNSTMPYNALSWITETYNLETKLSSMGYDVYGSNGASNLYAKSETIVEFSAIPDTPKKDSNSYNYVYVTPNISDNSYNNTTSTSTSKNSGMNDYYRRKWKEALDEAAKYEQMADMALASKDMSSYKTYRNMVLSAKQRAQKWLDMCK